MFTINCGGTLLSLDKPLVMGILNLTSDSFYAGSRVEPESLLQTATSMLEAGAAILDLGAQSTRPGSERLTATQELEKLLPALDLILSRHPQAILSIDTYYASVAEKCVAAGARIVNDISGGNLDADMLPAVAALRVPYVCMHMKGVPQTMQDDTNYDDVMQEVLDFFIGRVEACRQAGIADVIVDPGFGFGKNIAQNLELLRHLSVFQILDRPILCGLSRKSTIYKTLKITAEEALNGTTVLNTIALLNGASILRVHDVKEAREAIELVAAYQEGK